MSFPRYPNYKDSGIKWVGEIPVGWNIVRLKETADCNPDVWPEDTPEDTLIYYVEISDVDEYCGIKNWHELTFSSAPSRARRKVILGDVIISTVRTYLKAIAQIAFEKNNLTVSTGFSVFRAKSIEANYLSYALHCDFFLSEVISRSVGVSYPAINSSEIANLFIPLPPFSEQQAIASFLDRECGKIDALIAEQERLIALLAEKRQAVISHAVTKGLNPNAPMKDSGIPWIGMVPEGWNIVKIGKIFSEINEPGNDSLPILSVSIHSGVSDDELSEEKLDRKVTRSDDRSKYIVVRPGDLTYNMMRAWQGGFGAVQVLGMVSPAYVVARPKNIFWQETAFIELLLRTPNAIVEMKRHSRGVTDFRLRLYWDEFKNISIPLPKWEEQNSILNFIKKKTGQFDALSMVANKAIVLLKERRSALISAAVTGKIDVRNQSKANAA